MVHGGGGGRCAMTYEFRRALGFLGEIRKRVVFSS